MNLGLDARQPARLAQRVERPIHGDAMRPRAELRVPPVTGQRPENLNPDLLGDVGGKVRVPADQATDDHVDMRGVPGPKGPERPLIAIERASDDEGLVIHVCRIGHRRPTNGLRKQPNSSVYRHSSTSRIVTSPTIARRSNAWHWTQFLLAIRNIRWHCDVRHYRSGWWSLPPVDQFEITAWHHK